MPKNTEWHFWLKAQVKASKCWQWPSSRTDGYGMFRYNNKNWYAHRLAWTFANGKIPKGKHVLHTCDNPSCINPEHLWLGTHQDNMSDMLDKGRKSIHCCEGERHPGSKLTTEKIYAIRKLNNNGLSQREIAGMFSVSQPLICNILNNKTWKHIKRPK